MLCIFVKSVQCYMPKQRLFRKSWTCSASALPYKIVCDGDYTIAGHISNTNGMLMVSPPNYSSTSYIEVSGYDVIECQLPQSKCGGLAFYDADKRFLSAISSKNGEKIQSIYHKTLSI